MLTRNQVKMARAVLGWGIRDLAREAQVTANTVSRYENGANITLETLEKLRVAIEKAGVTLVPENGGPATIRPPKE